MRPTPIVSRGCEARGRRTTRTTSGRRRDPDGERRAPRIRAAERRDARSLAALCGQLGYPADPDQAADRLRSLRETGRDVVLVAEVDGEIVGWTHVTSAVRIESGAFAELGGLVVDEAWWRRGIGRALVRAAEAWARERGLPRLRVRSNVVRHDAHRFYAALGYERVKSQRVFSRRLDGNAP